MSQNPRTRPPARRMSQSGPSQSGQRPRNVNAPRRGDPFPIVVGGIVGALVVGLMVVVYLISSGGGTNGGGTASATATPIIAVVATTVPGTVDPNATAVPTTEAAPRMPLEDFKKLYDSANRPLIIDVRAKENFDQGHIRGAISFPEADVDTRVGELPKDKLIVAYCQ